MIRHLLYEEKYSIEGARRRLSAGRPLGAGGPDARSGACPPAEALERLRETAHDLNRLARTPIGRLFFL